MARIEIKTAYCVEFTEYERGWGQKPWNTSITITKRKPNNGQSTTTKNTITRTMFPTGTSEQNTVVG